MSEKPVVWAFWGHEPIQFYRRRDGNRRTLFGSGEWIDAWYRRLHTEEAMARLADMGVNLIYTHFYKAMGLEFEKEEMKNTARIVENAHKYGIRVLGYATVNSVFDEALACEIPDFDSMRIVRMNGMETDCFRESMCPSSRYYQEYFPKVLKYGIEQIGVDGFHLDNCGFRSCYCPRCVAGFRKYLEEHIEDPHSVGMPSFRHARIPIIPLVRGTDPISLMALRYYRWRYEAVLGKIFHYIKTLRPDNPPEVIINNGFADNRVNLAQGGYEIVNDHDTDYIFVETPDRFIGRREDGSFKNAVYAYKVAAMAGKKVFNTMWPSFGVEPKTPAMIKRVLAESMVFGGIVGTNWAARAVKHGDTMLMDTEMHFSVIKHCFETFKQNHGLYDNTHTLGDVQILYVPDARLAEGTAYEKILELTADAVAESGAVYSFAQLDGKRPESGLLLVPHAEYLSQHEVEEIRRLKESGVKLVFLGDAGVYREDGVEREDWPFRDEVLIPLPENTPESEAEFRQKVAESVEKAVLLNQKNILVERAVTSDGHRVVHLLNMDNDHPISDLEVRIPSEKGHLAGVVSLDDAEPKVTEENGFFRIERLETLVTLIFQE